MLVLSRKKDEKISIRLPERETPIEITVVRVDNLNKVRIGIEAESDVIVLRSELESRPIPVSFPKVH